MLPFARVALADLPIPIGGSSARYLGPTGRPVNEPAALLTVFDFRRKVLLTIGLYDVDGAAPELALRFSLSTPQQVQAGAIRASRLAAERNESVLEATSRTVGARDQTHTGARRGTMEESAASVCEVAA